MPSDDTSSKSNNVIPGANVVKDRPDVRDLPYRPSLGVLRGTQPVPKAVTGYPQYVRTQGDGSCTAHALAAVIDILRFDDKLRGRGKIDRAELVSAQMLYDRGKEIDSIDFGAHSDGGEGLWSLRSAIKAFYHNGVCETSKYADLATPNTGEPNEIRIYKNARQTPLGSYYRVDPVLNDYHAALNEVGVIYAAAEIHGGWLQEKVKANSGQILFDDKSSDSASGKHAFAIVGYNDKGFLVLNSWGADWGGYRESGGKPIKGVALWPYYDWAERILDGWVLRLGVKAPEAFKYSFGRQGLGDFLSGQIKEGSTPRFELMGHYAHLDDGVFVKAGTLPTKIEDVRDTRIFLEHKLGQDPDPKTGEPKSYKKLLVWIPGGSDKIKHIVANIAATKQFWRQRGVYPYTLIWCSDLLDQAAEVLSKFAEGALANVGRAGVSFDARVEKDARSIGRAVWRDVTESAKKAAASDKCGDTLGTGAALQILQEFARLDKEIEIHLVSEGAGAILVYELISENPDLTGRIASFTFVTPAFSVEVLKEFMRRSKATDRTRVLVPTPAVSARLRYGDYNGSMLDLVQMSFVENPPDRIRDLNTEQQRKRNEAISDKDRIVGVMSAAEIRSKVAGLEVAEIDEPKGNERISNLRDVTAGKDVDAKILKIMGITQTAERGDYGPVRGNAVAPPAEQVIEIKSHTKPARPEVRPPGENPAPAH